MSDASRVVGAVCRDTPLGMSRGVIGIFVTYGFGHSFLSAVVEARIMPIYTRDGGRFGLYIGSGEPPHDHPRIQIRDPDIAPIERGPVAERVPDHVDTILDRIGVGDIVAGGMGSGRSGRRGQPSGGDGSAVRRAPVDIGVGAGAGDGMGIDIWEWEARKEAARQTGQAPLEIGVSRRSQRSHVEYHGPTRNHEKK